MSGGQPFSPQQSGPNQPMRNVGQQQVTRIVTNTSGQRVPVTINLPNQGSNQQMYYTQRGQANMLVRGEAPSNARVVGVVPPMRQPPPQQVAYSRSHPSSLPSRSPMTSQGVYSAQSQPSSSGPTISIQQSGTTFSTQPQQSQQMRPQGAPQVDETVQRCHKFFSTLLALARKSQNYPRVAELVKKLFEDKISVEVFKEELQNTLHSVAQPHLVPFLRNSLPSLRHLVQTNKIFIEGLNAPSREQQQQTFVPNVSHPPQSQQDQQSQQPIYSSNQPTTSAYMMNSGNQPIYVQRPGSGQPPGPTAQLLQQGNVHGQQRIMVQRGQTPQHTQGVTTAYVRQNVQMRSPTPQMMGAPGQQSAVQMVLQSGARPNSQQSQHNASRGSDGIGVDLSEENKNMQQMGLSEEVLQQPLRRMPMTGPSTHGQPPPLHGQQPQASHMIPNQIEEQVSILDRNGVLLLVGQMCREKLNNNRVKSSALSILGQAVRFKLTQMIKQMRLIALHKSVRMTTMQTDTDVRERLRLLERIERDQQQRDAEEERKELMKLASSKSGKKSSSANVEDDDLKQRAKNLKTAEEEAQRSAQANAAAFAALRNAGVGQPGTSMKREPVFDPKATSQALWQPARKPKSIHVFVRDIITYLESDSHFDASARAFRLRLTGKRSGFADQGAPPPKRPHQ